jgi:hypothetical protein
MTLWLYTEDESPMRDGPFFSEVDAAMSMLWEWLGVCVWIEDKTARGCTYENVRWDGNAWVITSSGVRPLVPERPEFLLAAVPCVKAVV